MISKKVEKGKLSERIGRKVVGLKHCHCESNESRRSNLIQCYDSQTTDFIFFHSLSLKGRGQGEGEIFFPVGQVSRLSTKK